MLKINQIEGSEKSYTIDDQNGRIDKYHACHRAAWYGSVIRVFNVYSGVTYEANYDDMEINGIVPDSIDDAMAKLEFMFPFNSGGGASGIVGDTRLILSVQKTGTNGRIFPTPFAWEKSLKVENVVTSKNVLSADFTIAGVSYSQTTLKGVTLPYGEDLIINDIVIAAGYDVGSLTLIFEIL